MPDVHFLKKKGVKYLSDRIEIDINSITYRKNSKPLYQDLNHRTNTINCHIALSKALTHNNISLRRADHYFQRRKNRSTNRHNIATKLIMDNCYIIPDSCYIIDSMNPTVFFYELHNGYRISRIEQKMKQYTQVLAS